MDVEKEADRRSASAASTSSDVSSNFSAVVAPMIVIWGFYLQCVGQAHKCTKQSRSCLFLCTDLKKIHLQTQQ